MTNSPVPPSPKGEGDSYVARVARGAGISTVGQGIGRLAGYLIQVAIARLFGPAQFGFYVLGLTAVNGANILSQFGMDNGVVRYVAHYAAGGDTSRVRGTIVQAVWITFALSLILSAGMFLGAGFVAEWWYGKPFMETIYRAFALSLPFFTLMSMLLWATQGFQTVTYAAYTQQIIRPLANLALLILFYFVGAQIVGAIAAYTVSMVLGSLVALYYLRRLFPPLLDRETPATFETRALFNVSVPMSVTTITQYVNSWAAVWVLGAFAAAGPVGIFTAALRTAALSSLVRFAFGGIFSPIISNFYSRGEMDELGRLYKDVARWVFTGGLAAFALISVLADDILLVFGPQFTTGLSSLVIVAAAQLYSSSVGPTPRMLAMTNNQNLVMAATAASALAAVGASYALIPLYGVLGAALATAAAIFVETTGTLLAVWYRLGFWPYHLRYLRPLAAGILAVAAAYLAGWLLALPNGLLAILVLTPVFGVVFVALLLAFGLSDTDKEFLRAFWNVAKRYLRRGPRNDSQGTSNG